MGIFTKKGKADAQDYKESRVYDYETPEGRVATASWLFEQAKNERAVQEMKWVKYNDYYNFRHQAIAETAEAMEEMGLAWTPAMVPDAYVMVESQIVPQVPQPEFRGRDRKMDPETAKQRGLAVKYICEANRLEDMNTANERRLRKLGDAFWKAYYDETMPFGERSGNIRIKDISPYDIYVDPCAGAEGLQAGEYVIYLYAMHKMAFRRKYGDMLAVLGKTTDEMTGSLFRAEDNPFDDQSHPEKTRSDLVQVMEFWFRQSENGEGHRAGDIACSIQAAGVELQYEPCYWQTVGGQCQLFPFVHYWCVRDETQFYNRSELEPIIPLIDAADRQITIAQINDAMMANDVVLVEEGSLVPGEEFSNVPGKVIRVSQGRKNDITRLGGLHDGVNSLPMVKWYLDQIQRANRNYDTNNGQESARITTASGLLQLRSDAQEQSRLKQADRDRGFVRLYELLDYLALEFFDDDRLLVIGAEKKGEEPEAFVYNRDNFFETVPEVTDPATGEVLQEQSTYFPRIDVTVSVGNPIAKNPVATVEVLDKLTATTVTEDNWRMLAAELEYLDIPQKQSITEQWETKFGSGVPKEIVDALGGDPELMAAVGQIVAMRGQTAAQSVTAPMEAVAGLMPTPESPAMTPEEIL